VVSPATVGAKGRQLVLLVHSNNRRVI